VAGVTERTYDSASRKSVEYGMFLHYVLNLYTSLEIHSTQLSKKPVFYSRYNYREAKMDWCDLMISSYEL